MSKNKRHTPISVIMPVFNAAEYLPTAIESILNQTYTDFELIIIDDGSRDSSWEIIKRYSVLDKRIKAKRNSSNLGICRTLNDGLSLAVGEYIARMDSDDWSYPDRLGKQLNFMKGHPEVVICGSAIEVCDRDLKLINRRSYPPSDRKIRKRMLTINPFAHPATMYKRQAVLKAGGYNEKLFTVEDYDLYFRLGNWGKFANLADTLLKLRIRDDSISYTNVRRQTALNLYVRLKAAAEYGYAWRITDLVYFIAGLVGTIVIPARHKFKFWNAIRTKLR